jgi:hypothetical protein
MASRRLALARVYQLNPSNPRKQDVSNPSLMLQSNFFDLALEKPQRQQKLLHLRGQSQYDSSNRFASLPDEIRLVLERGDGSEDSMPSTVQIGKGRWREETWFDLKPAARLTKRLRSKIEGKSKEPKSSARADHYRGEGTLGREKKERENKLSFLLKSSCSCKNLLMTRSYSSQRLLANPTHLAITNNRSSDGRYVAKAKNDDDDGREQVFSARPAESPTTTPGMSKSVSTYTDFNDQRPCFDDLPDAKDEPSSNQDEEEAADVLAWFENNRIPRPNFLPVDWKIGDPIPGLPVPKSALVSTSVGQLPSGKRNYDGQKARSVELLDELFDGELGSNARNQLARKSEYLAQLKLAEGHLNNMFSSPPPLYKECEGSKIPILHTHQWFFCVHPEAELRYDNSPKVSAFVTTFYVSFVGCNLPERKVWEPSAKIEMLCLSFEEVETEFYVARSDPKNPYKPGEKVKDPKVLDLYCTPSPKGVDVDMEEEKEEKEEVGCWLKRKDPDGIVYSRLLTDLTKSPYRKAFFCKLGSTSCSTNRGFWDGTLERRPFGHSEMLKRELESREKKLLAAGSLLSFPDSEEICNEKFSDSCDLSKVSYLCHPESGVLYLNGSKFRKRHLSALQATWPGPEKAETEKKRTKFGFGMLKNNVRSYRVNLRTSACSVHFIDHAPSMYSYPDKEGFDKYFQSYKALSGGAEGKGDVEVNLQRSSLVPFVGSDEIKSTLFDSDRWKSLPRPGRPPLMSPEEKLECERLNINVDLDVRPVSATELPRLIALKAKEIKGATGVAPTVCLPANKRRKITPSTTATGQTTASASTSVTSLSNGSNVENKKPGRKTVVVPVKSAVKKPDATLDLFFSTKK